MSLCCATNIISSQYITAVCNSELVSKYTEGFINSTVIFQINDCRQIPIVIPDETKRKELTSIFERAKSVMITNDKDTKDALKDIKKELEIIVLKLYNL